MLIRMCWSSRYSGSEIMGFSYKEKGMGLEVTGQGQTGEGHQPRGGECWRKQACTCYYEAHLNLLFMPTEQEGSHRCSIPSKVTVGLSSFPVPSHHTAPQAPGTGPNPEHAAPSLSSLPSPGARQASKREWDQKPGPSAPTPTHTLSRVLS